MFTEQIEPMADWYVHITMDADLLSIILYISEGANAILNLYSFEQKASCYTYTVVHRTIKLDCYLQSEKKNTIHNSVSSIRDVVVSSLAVSASMPFFYSILALE